MTNLTTVGLTNGAGSSGTGSVSTLDNVFQTGTPIAVKAASTAAVATDPALVVALSPNNVNANLNVNANTGVTGNYGAPNVLLDIYSKYQSVAASQTTK